MKSCVFFILISFLILGGFNIALAQETVNSETDFCYDQTCPTGAVEQKFLDKIMAGNYSLPVLAVLLGALDGFNICSLGALVLILALVLSLRSRKKIIIFGGIFILTTAIVYALLILLWHQLFSLLAPYVKVMKGLIGALAIAGGIYFLKQFIKYRKYGPTCEIKPGKNIFSKFSLKLKQAFKKPGNILTILGTILLFAAVITIVEFPCSAVIPITFAGILSEAHLPAVMYLLYIALFILFYMLDEIIVFLFAVFKMTVWLSSSKFVTWITLIEAITLFLLGGYYLIGLF